MPTASRALASPGPPLAPVAAKMLAVRTVAPIVAAAMHAVQAGIFLALDLPGLALLSVGSVALFAVTLALIRGGWPMLGLWLIYAEIAAHASLLTVLFGIEVGYALYVLALASAGLVLFRPEERAHQVAGVTVAAALIVALLIGSDRAPLWTLPEAHARFLLWMNWLGIAFGLVAILAFATRSTARAERALERERARSEALLRNVLPASIAERLKARPGLLVDEVPEATVLFADLVGFTPLAAQVSPSALIGLLDTLFSRFDGLARERGLEKIKTIGDAYMVVGGVPEPLSDHVARVVDMAFAMREAVRACAEEQGLSLQLRVGIHTGPVLAGVIGTEKFSYDLWGDTVNVASRMESHGEPGRVQITDAVREALEGRFVLLDRGPIEVKGRGALRTWFVEPPGADPGAPVGVPSVDQAG